MAISNAGVGVPSPPHMASQKVAYFAIFTGEIVIYALFVSIHRGEEKKGKRLRWVQVIEGKLLASHTWLMNSPPSSSEKTRARGIESCLMVSGEPAT